MKKKINIKSIKSKALYLIIKKLREYSKSTTKFVDL